ncbi:uncharacterized protein V1513DRAFT_446512 [Lipomyces chichibuensis]|uniref:uncharacterized protein n=1 Tax=Lipomyces chichibuensis TaxID=1546026 RepID=UPI003342EFFD
MPSSHNIFAEILRDEPALSCSATRVCRHAVFNLLLLHIFHVVAYPLTARGCTNKNNIFQTRTTLQHKFYCIIRDMDYLGTFLR